MLGQMAFAPTAPMVVFDTGSSSSSASTFRSKPRSSTRPFSLVALVNSCTAPMKVVSRDAASPMRVPMSSVRFPSALLPSRRSDRRSLSLGGGTALWWSVGWARMCGDVRRRRDVRLSHGFWRGGRIVVDGFSSVVQCRVMVAWRAV